MGTCDLFAAGISQAGKTGRAVATVGFAGSDPGSLVQSVRCGSIRNRTDIVL